MSARLAAEKAELEAVVAFLGQRLFARAGDAAELRESLAAAHKELAALKKAAEAKSEETPDPLGR